MQQSKAMNKRSKRASVRSRGLGIVALILSATCSGDGNPPGSLGELKGAAYYGGPLAGAPLCQRS